MPPDSKETKLGSSNQEASPLADKNTDELQQMSSQWLLLKLLQGLVSHKLTAYLSIFNLFKLNELWPYQKHVNAQLSEA